MVNRMETFRRWTAEQLKKQQNNNNNNNNNRNKSKNKNNNNNNNNNNNINGDDLKNNGLPTTPAFEQYREFLDWCNKEKEGNPSIIWIMSIHSIDYDHSNLLFYSLMLLIYPSLYFHPMNTLEKRAVFTNGHQNSGFVALEVTIEYVVKHFDKLSSAILNASKMETVVKTLQTVPGIGPFYSWQMSCDLLETGRVLQFGKDDQSINQSIISFYSCSYSYKDYEQFYSLLLSIWISCYFYYDDKYISSITGILLIPFSSSSDHNNNILFG